jgi:hypothetical protein
VAPKKKKKTKKAKGSEEAFEARIKKEWSELVARTRVSEREKVEFVAFTLLPHYEDSTKGVLTSTLDVKGSDADKLLRLVPLLKTFKNQCWIWEALESGQLERAGALDYNKRRKLISGLKKHLKSTGAVTIPGAVFQQQYRYVSGPVSKSKKGKGKGNGEKKSVHVRPHVRGRPKGSGAADEDDLTYVIGQLRQAATTAPLLVDILRGHCPDPDRLLGMIGVGVRGTGKRERA